MDNLYLIVQFILSCIIFLCVVTSVVAHTIMGNIATLLGFFASFIFLFLTGMLVRMSWVEMRTELKK